MTELRDSVPDAVRAILADPLEPGDVHPSALEIAVYLRGELEGEDLEELLDHLARCPACAQAVVSNSGPLSVLDGEPGEEAAGGFAAFWRRFEADQTGAPIPIPAPAPPAPRVRRRRGLAEYRQGLVGLAAGLMLGLLVPALSWLRNPPAVVRLNEPFLQLLPEAEALKRGASAAPAVVLPPRAEAFTLLLSLVDPGDFETYRLELRPQAGQRPLWQGSGLRLQAGLGLRVDWPRGLLPSGEYRLDLYGVQGREERWLARYFFQLQVE